MRRRYHYPRLDDIEDLEKYRPGGFHPVTIGQVFAGGRYKALHKLGFGGSSTVWLARDQHSQEQPQRSGRLVALKILSAEQSSNPTKEFPELYISQELDAFSRAHGHVGRENIQFIQDHFMEKGPNGVHRCLVSQFAGPSILSMAECPGRVSGSRRLRGDLARKVAKQVATAVECMHSAGIVHGDLTSSNILFKLSSEVDKWTDDDVYDALGTPEMEEVATRDGSPPGPCAPSQVVAPIDVSRLSSSSLLQENILVTDFGQSFFIKSPPTGYEPATPLHYLSPEAYFESKMSFASDIWALACMIFEIRAGSPLFDPFLSSATQILKQIVETLDKFPEPWWSLWEARHIFFDETGVPKSQEVQIDEGVMIPAEKSSLRQKLHEIGEQDDAPDVYEGRMIENVGTQLEEVEIELLEGLLEKMLRYRPEDRITMTEVVEHPWFAYK
ncbi:kinase-like protein [Laetiporus sulphureus 93-53]|uniref:non-specific serine/threonine protein kinase n=1 Tax=Laetiporus sulphureus 93-53 TaxID=1314785 RepID=A0A165EG12_9APHY|nr:kinase-like protein [Laetiporus sulphureus 93-53]KZT06982.1 kinase-like protein [Laetiporus sulphureus 93-53]